MKKMELIIVGVVFVIIGIIAFFVVQANRITSTITIDINPSVEIELNKDNKVMNVNALNTDARKVVVKKDSLNETVEAICEKVVEEGL